MRDTLRYLKNAVRQPDSDTLWRYGGGLSSWATKNVTELGSKAIGSFFFHAHGQASLKEANSPW